MPCLRQNSAAFPGVRVAAATKRMASLLPWTLSTRCWPQVPRPTIAAWIIGSGYTTTRRSRGGSVRDNMPPGKSYGAPMAAVVQRNYRVNELTPDPSVVFDRKIAEQYLRYAHMLAARGLVYSSTGNLVMRV